MDVRTKLSILADAAKYDASCASSGVKRKAVPGGVGNSEGMGICHSYTPDGRCVSLLKILLTNHCLYDCRYCVNRVSNSVRRAKFTVAEIVSLTMDFYRRNYIEGLFLSSGIIRSSDETMEEMIEVARRLRVEERFGGYIHLKAVAGCARPLLERAGLYADRLSANIELPTQADLDRLAPAKSQASVETAMDQIRDKIAETKEHREKFRSTPRFAPGGQSTQMIVGATPSSDAEILRKSSQLYADHGLKRVYYSAFSPIPGSDPALPSNSPPLLREHRLYQADWLMRFYGFAAGELTTAPTANLELLRDPKLAWALRNRDFFPVDVNAAALATLLRVPGLGLKGAEKIVEMRKFRRLRLEDLGKMHLPMAKLRYFVTALGPNPHARRLDGSAALDEFGEGPAQLELFAASPAPAAVTGRAS